MINVIRCGSKLTLLVKEGVPSDLFFISHKNVQDSSHKFGNVNMQNT